MTPVKSLKPRALDLLESLADGRFVTSQQASTYIWGHRNSANKALKQLEQARLIHRTFDRVLGTSIIRPTKAGLAALAAQRRHVAVLNWSWKQLWLRSVGFIHHEVLVNEIRFAVLRACRQRGDVTMATRCGPGCVRCVDGVTIRPDREIVFGHAATGRQLLLFVEVDRGTRSIRSDRANDIIGQLELYEHYRAAEGTKPFRVLMLCPSAQRINNIVNAAAAVDLPGSGRRGYSVITEFISDPLGSLVTIEGDRARLRSLLGDWRVQIKPC